MLNNWMILFRLILAALLSGAVGFEREFHGRAAGFRTHILLCVGSTLIMLTSMHIFDLYSSRAKRLGDILVVGLNSDSSVRKIKGKNRPINKESDRAKVLSSLYFVDYITIFNETTPENLIKKVRPDILAKGADWKVGDIAGSSFVKKYGGRIKRISFVKGYSTTSIIKRSSHR